MALQGCNPQLHRASDGALLSELALRGLLNKGEPVLDRVVVRPGATATLNVPLSKPQGLLVRTDTIVQTDTVNGVVIRYVYLPGDTVQVQVKCPDCEDKYFTAPITVEEKNTEWGCFELFLLGLWGVSLIVLMSVWLIIKTKKPR